ncbi:UDP-N-acetylmuramoyl-tripeptide--D-alanyl-D-alanine ligase [Francisella sp. Scap27]|uniref:UDP-N-acetylmuramoyl-tripeptide--D-alanyl-D- alanine ligase n=1 Tax=Francisella sp. Scap27 TaxID=2589986 RepID=UPI0015BFC798|nr:UDP-N-acetylmuramoyl-tripeptide--D-alanyl-D-alanine ligase [Francisella sp. Scap27]QLE79732.1 UDP-N-acetylmuramoyl-tripeptide--D-alanyl-D-alanine ligase [Francisella sp. Scap27]
MIRSLKKLAEQAGFEYFGDDTEIQTVAINSNDIQDNCLFVAIVANRDGHEFIPQALSSGAKAVLVSKKQDLDIPQIVCGNTIKGLRKLATKYRKSLSMPIISLTGSCGKTTVKEMIVTLLGDKKVHFTKGNLNNYLGVPMTILETPQDAEYAVVEAGTNVGGEIKAAAEVIQPDIALITNVGACHLENLKTLDGVMTEKGELLKALPKNGCSVINLDDERISDYAEKLECKKITCSMQNSKADIYIRKYELIDNVYCVDIIIFDRQYSYKLANIGKHNLFNSILAIGSLIAAGLTPDEVLANTQNIKNYAGRFSSEKITKNITLVDDSYNASVSAVEAAIDDLNEFEGNSILVLSAMRELGEEAEYYHRHIGKTLKNSNIDNVLLYGDNEYVSMIVEEANKPSVVQYKAKAELEEDLYSTLRNENSEFKIIVKGARFYKMEEIIEFVKIKFSK